MEEVSMRLIFILISLVFSIPSYARLLQIIHTNDLHSFFPGYLNNTGGYGRAMTKIKELRAEARNKGIEVLQLDGGDWGDGTSFFLSDNGADSIRALEMLGVDITTIGNHDHMLGGKVLGDQIRRAQVKTKFTAANITTTPEMELKGVVTPFVDVEKAGIKIRVIGLTTSDNFHEYSIRPGSIESPITVGEAEAKTAKAAGRELVIALTHIGKWQDRILANQSASIDVIVGGHSHTKMTEVDWVTNRNGKRIPIVQAWAHGLGVGSLLIDVSDSGIVKVVDYKLHEVGTPILPDPEMEEFIEKSATKRNHLFETPWDEVIGHTETPIRGYKNGMPNWSRSCWGNHMARAIRKATGSNLGIHMPSFAGVGKAPGPVTFGDIVDNQPHIHTLDESSKGWEIATIYMAGWRLRPLMYWASRRGYAIDMSGIGYKEAPSDLEKVQIDRKASYKIAIPAEMVYGIKGSLQQYQHYLVGLKFTGKHFWPVLTEYVKDNSPIKCD
jgi:2',3'-cyclic-nucleotide 2'-phosphodiesterase (5'-nucleotidase family)